MILENLIEIKKGAQMHDENTFLACQDAIQSVLPGNVAILCDKHLEATESGLLMPDGKWKGSQNSDTGTVLHSGYRYLKAGDRVGFLPMHGIRLSAPEYKWVPEGCEIRIYGVACPVNESLVRIEE